MPNPNTAVPGHQTAEQAAAQAEKVPYVNPTPWLCTSDKCSPVIGKFIAYWNSFHVSVPYARYLTGVLGSALEGTLPSPTG
jgi:hypothetical protein